MPEGRIRTQPSSYHILIPSVVSILNPSPEASCFTISIVACIFLEGTFVFALKYSGTLLASSESLFPLDKISRILAQAIAPSLQYWCLGKIRPPLPSPPNTAFTSIIFRATLIEPTAVQYSLMSASFAMSAMRWEELTGVTIGPLSCSSIYFAIMASRTSSFTKTPFSSINTILSASPSWATPMSAPVIFTSLVSSVRASGKGSGFRQGKVPSGWASRVNTWQPSLLSKKGRVREPAPQPVSTTTLNLRLRMASAFTELIIFFM